jgi:hypothetical protein
MNPKRNSDDSHGLTRRAKRAAGRRTARRRVGVGFAGGTLGKTGFLVKGPGGVES